LALPFAFSFRGGTFNQAFVTTNGILGFDAGTWAYDNQPLPFTYPWDLFPAYAVFAFWDDLFTTDGNGICTATVGAPGARRFVVTWSRMRFYGAEDATSLTFSAILHEGTNQLELVYYDMSTPQSGRGSGLSATIGLQGPVTQATQHSFDQAVITNGTRLTF
jgi:hypothetical protein